MQLIWQVYSQTGEIVWTTTAVHTPGTWWPDLTPDFCQLAAGIDWWDIPDQRPNQLSSNMAPKTQQDTIPGCSTPTARCRLAQSDFYVCPRDGRDRSLARKCGGYEEYFCAKWGCETTGDAYWAPTSSWDLIQVIKNFSTPQDYPSFSDDDPYPCAESSSQFSLSLSLPLKIQFTPQGKTKLEPWITGRTWGLRWYLSGTDKGVTFTIKLKQLPKVNLPIGPNPVLGNQKVPSPPRMPPKVAPVTVTSVISVPAPSPTISGTGDRLFNLVQGAYQALNTTYPNKTLDCWLCLASSPPYYEGIATTAGWTNSSTPNSKCSSLPSSKLTIPEVSGQGLCIGKVPRSHHSLCNQTLPTQDGHQYIWGPSGTYWACNTGLTPCVSTAILNVTTDFCVLVQLWPRISYLQSEYVLSHLEGQKRYPREPISLTIALDFKIFSFLFKY